MRCCDVIVFVFDFFQNRRHYQLTHLSFLPSLLNTNTITLKPTSLSISIFTSFVNIKHNLPTCSLTITDNQCLYNLLRPSCPYHLNQDNSPSLKQVFFSQILIETLVTVTCFNNLPENCVNAFGGWTLYDILNGHETADNHKKEYTCLSDSNR